MFFPEPNWTVLRLPAAREASCWRHRCPCPPAQSCLFPQQLAGRCVPVPVPVPQHSCSPTAIRDRANKVGRGRPGLVWRVHEGHGSLSGCVEVLQKVSFFFFSLYVLNLVIFIYSLLLYLEIVSFGTSFSIIPVVFSYIFNFYLSFAGWNQIGHTCIWLLRSPLSCIFTLYCESIRKPYKKLAGTQFLMPAA